MVLTDSGELLVKFVGHDDTFDCCRVLLRLIVGSLTFNCIHLSNALSRQIVTVKFQRTGRLAQYRFK